MGPFPKAVISAVAFVLLAFLAALAFGGTVVNVQSVTWELRDGESHPISKGYKTYEECEAAGKVTPGKYLCIGRTTFNVVGVCDPLPPPPPVVNAQGFTERGELEGHACPDGPNGPELYFTQTQPVRDPYPSCAWVDRPVKITECVGIVNPWWEPNSPAVSKYNIDDRPEIDTNGTAQTDQTPSQWIEGADYPLGEPCPEAAPAGCVASPNVPPKV